MRRHCHLCLQHCTDSLLSIPVCGKVSKKLHQLTSPTTCLQVDQPGSAIDTYVNKLGAILDQKSAGIKDLQRRLESFKRRLKEEEVMSQSVGKGGRGK